MTNPTQVRRLFNKVCAAIGDKINSANKHNTRGVGLVYCLAAYDVGVRTFNASLGSLGGCPRSAGASGNVLTEDLVFVFEVMGIKIGVDIDKLIATRDSLQVGLPGESIYGTPPLTCLPKGWA